MTIARAILITLDQVHPNMLPELTLLADVNLRVHETVTLSPLRRELAMLEAKKQVVSSAANEDRGTQYKITAAGQARLAE